MDNGTALFTTTQISNLTAKANISDSLAEPDSLPPFTQRVKGDKGSGSARLYLRCCDGVGEWNDPHSEMNRGSFYPYIII